jgi:hypothetical protein
MDTGAELSATMIYRDENTIGMDLADDLSYLILTANNLDLICVSAQTRR